MRSLTESDLYEKQSAEIGAAENIDKALIVVTWAISKNPLAFDEIPNTNGLRMAKTTAYTDGNSEVPALRLAFRVQDEEQIILEAIGVIPEGFDDEGF